MKSILFTIAALTSLSAVAAHAQSAEMSVFAEDTKFDAAGYSSTDGEVLYQTLCAGCHMPDGAGAVGAGHYPALKDNPNLEYAAYPVTLIVNGQGAMPAFGTFLDDEQIVALVTYIQTHLGNDFTPDVTVETVTDARPAAPENPNKAEHE